MDEKTMGEKRSPFQSTLHVKHRYSRETVNRFRGRDAIVLYAHSLIGHPPRPTKNP